LKLTDFIVLKAAGDFQTTFAIQRRRQAKLPKIANGQGPEVCSSRQARDFEAVTGLTM
jgi:hypothetical protein